MKIIALLCVGLMALAQFSSLNSTSDGQLPCGLTNFASGSTLAKSWQSARQGQAPFLARLINTKNPAKHLCNAVIIDQSNLLTAADCVYNTKPDELMVVYGDYDILDNNDGNLVAYVWAVTPTQVRGVSFVTTTAKLKFNLPETNIGCVNQVCLAPSGSGYNGDLLFMGWDLQFTILIEANFKQIDNQQCELARMSVLENDICLQGSPISLNSLGGALVRRLSNGRWELVAMVVNSAGNGLIVGARYNK